MNTCTMLRAILITTFPIATSYPINAQSSGFIQRGVLISGAMSQNPALAADIDGDQLKDIVAGGAWYKNLGNRIFGPAQLFPGPALRARQCVDLDNDGDIDIVREGTVSANGDWIENLGAGQFRSHTLPWVNLLPQTSDINGDGLLDIVATFIGGALVPRTYLVWMQNNGDGSFSSARTVLQFINDRPGIKACRPADIDADGDMDIVFKVAMNGVGPYWLDQAIYWRENIGGGSMGRIRSIISDGHHVGSTVTGEVIVEDFNGDGLPDVIASHFGNGPAACAANRDFGCSPSNIRLAKKTASGWSQGALPIHVGELSSAPEPIYLTAADIDGDGDTDFVASTADQTWWRENDGTGTFGVHRQIATQGGALLATDLDGDGDQDIAYSSPTGIIWFENKVSQWPASVSTFGTGCGNPRLIFQPQNRPVIGSRIRATVINSPSTTCLIGVGLSNALFGASTLPVDLSYIGMTGCSLFQSCDDILPVTGTTPGGAVDFWASIPSETSLFGLSFYGQAFAPAPGLNPARLASSNAIGWHIGLQ